MHFLYGVWAVGADVKLDALGHSRTTHCCSAIDRATRVDHVRPDKFVLKEHQKINQRRNLSTTLETGLCGIVILFEHSLYNIASVLSRSPNLWTANSNKIERYNFKAFVPADCARGRPRPHCCAPHTLLLLRYSAKLASCKPTCTV